MNYDALLLLALTMMAFSIKPGPGMLAVASRAMSERGMWSVAAFMVGNNLAKLVFLLLVVLGFGAMNDIRLFVVILAKSFAAVYLIYLGIQGFLKEQYKIEEQAETVTPPHNSLWQDLSIGFVITITNPYDIIFFAGIIPTIIPIEQIGFVEYWVIFLTMLAADIAVVLSYTLPLRYGKKFFAARKIPFINHAANIVLVVAGLIIGLSAIFSGQIVPH
jgi:threonine/homoserine/homoserine lactone efflux protein